MTASIPQRYATHPEQIPGMTTAQLRERFLVDDVFVAGEVRLTYTHHDRIVLGGAVPAGSELALTGYPEIRSEYFLEHREVGIVNVGAAGTVTADGEVYELVTGACLYLGRGVREVVFADAATGEGARFYLFSAPAHTSYPSALVCPGEGTVRELGDRGEIGEAHQRIARRLGEQQPRRRGEGLCQRVEVRHVEIGEGEVVAAQHLVEQTERAAVDVV